MKPAEREAWIIGYLSPRQAVFARSSGTRYTVDVLNADFAWAYIEATGARAAVQFYGAPKCPMLGDDLSRMYRRGALERVLSPLGEGSRNLGFPPWVWSYHLPRSTWAGLEYPTC